MGRDFVVTKEKDLSSTIYNIDEFDRNSGSLVERIIFNNRLIILLICAILTIFLGSMCRQTVLNASFNKMIPVHQSFIVNYLNHFEDLQSEGNSIQIAVQANNGTIIDAHYLSVLQKLNDEVFLLPGVDRPFMTSLWTPSTRWLAVTPDGLQSGPVIDTSYDGSPAALNTVRQNIQQTGKVGELVSSDFTASMIYVPLLETNNLTGKPLNYGDFARRLNQLREKYNAQGVTLHIVGFAMVVGDIIDGIGQILSFFLVSVAIATVVLFWYTRCLRSTFLVVTASIIAVIWQLGLIPLFGFDINPYSVLVPFLIFAIGMSHGAQKMNGVMQDIGRGAHPLLAARYTFRRLFLAGFAALTCDAVSFAVLLTIKIEAIRELAIIASVGVGILILTNLILLPIFLSFTGVSQKAALRSITSNNGPNAAARSSGAWAFLGLFTTGKFATPIVCGSIILGIFGYVVGQRVQVGDLNPGAPELRQDSQYNRDNSYILSHFTTGTDTMVVMMDTPRGGCVALPAVETYDRLEWTLDQLPQVQSTWSVASFMRTGTMLFSENSPKWFSVVHSQASIDDLTTLVPLSLRNVDCSFLPLYISLSDHKAATLDSVIKTVQSFIAKPKNQTASNKISLAGGNAGIEAATNIVIAQANDQILYLVYVAVIIFCFVTFRSWRAVLCAVIPLILTSLLGQMLMVFLGIGIKVATLPVIALGVGIGVDYALYVLSVVLRQMRAGATLSEAYKFTLQFTGRVVLLTGLTLATCVVTWIFSPIKFQVDMGLLLAFMFIWNMFGALILLPSLAYFLLPPRLFVRASEETIFS